MRADEELCLILLHRLLKLTGEGAGGLDPRRDDQPEDDGEVGCGEGERADRDDQELPNGDTEESAQRAHREAF